MPRSTTLIKIFFSVLLCSGLYFIEYNKGNKDRLKEFHLKPKFNGTFLRHSDKIRGPITVQIIPLQPMDPHQSKQIFSVKGLIQTENTISQLSWHWEIPNGLQVVNGDLDGTQNSVSTDEPIESTLILLNSTTDNQQIHLMVKGQQTGEDMAANMDFGAVAQFNTQDQNAIDRSNRDLASRTKKQLEKEDPSSLTQQKIKIFH